MRIFLEGFALVGLVNIESDKALKGIFVQGRKPNGTEPIGTFINIPAETHLVECSTVCDEKNRT